MPKPKIEYVVGIQLGRIFSLTPFLLQSWAVFSDFTECLVIQKMLRASMAHHF
jgi:hypothetical protein